MQPPVDEHTMLSRDRNSCAAAISGRSRAVMKASERATQPNRVWITNREAS